MAFAGRYPIFLCAHVHYRVLLCILYASELDYVGHYLSIVCDPAHLYYGLESAFVVDFPIPCVLNGPNWTFSEILSSCDYTVSELTCLYREIVISSNQP